MRWATRALGVDVERDPALPSRWRCTTRDATDIPLQAAGQFSADAETEAYRMIHRPPADRGRLASGGLWRPGKNLRNVRATA